VQVLSYTENNLTTALSNKYTPAGVISEKNHFRYLKGYLGDTGLNAKTVVVEEDYLSKDFIQDYASCYAFCFEPYPKFCKRVHFFANDFNEDAFNAVMILSREADNNEFWNNYLGFVVVKPIPTTVIGYTVLKTYAAGQDFNNLIIAQAPTITSFFPL
jgi:hypothetical protein